MFSVVLECDAVDILGPNQLVQFFMTNNFIHETNATNMVLRTVVARYNNTTVIVERELIYMMI